MEYKALALDLDGTLTDSKKRLSKRNKETIHKAIERGVAVILATGRPLLGVKDIAAELELSKRGGYILSCNGGIIVDCKTDEVLYQRVMPSECIHSICEIAKANDVIAMTYTNDQIVAEDDEDEYMMKEALCVSATIKKVVNLEEFVDYPVPKFLVVGEHKKLIPVQEELLKLHSDKLDAYFSSEYFLEVVPAGVSKSSSLESLMKILGYTRQELMACGDGMNDIPMLEYAGLAVAVENAYPEVKEYADYITTSNDDDGVANAIEKYILK